MFTGLVEAVGTITRISDRGDVKRVTFQAPFCAEIKRGDSICVSGVCTTAIFIDKSSFTVELSQETMRVTRFSSLSVGSKVNLERALPVTGRLNGHIVAGHVDGVGTVVALERDTSSAVLKVAVPAEVSRYIIHKGSVCVDGISLTVVDASEREFSVAVIPETLDKTSLGELNNGDKVNIETDILGRYVEKFMINGLNLPQKVQPSPKKSTLTPEKLAEMGW